MSKKNITREDIVRSIRASLGFSLAETNEIIKNINNSIIEVLLKEGSISFPNFGTMSLVEKASREGKNLKSGEVTVVVKRNVIRFSPAKELKRKVNS